MLEALTYVAIIVLLPLLPAFLLYKFLPAGQTDVSGPFHGLDIKLSGAFAGYFLVVLLSTSFTVFLIKRQPTPTPPAPPPVYEYSVYTVNGKVDLHSRDPKTGDLNYKQFSLSLEPPERTIKPDGSFSFEIPVQRGQVGEPVFPDLVLEYQAPEYEPMTVHLSEKSPYKQPFQVLYNKEAKTIDITPEIQIPHTTQPYKPNARAIPLNDTAENQP